MKAFAIGPVHEQTEADFLDLQNKLVRRRPRQETGQVVMRMNLWFRIAQWGIMASFPTLIVTGFALKFPDSWWAKPLLMWESNAGVRGGLHRTAAVVMIVATLFHFVHLAMKKRDRSIIPALLPTIKDVHSISSHWTRLVQALCAIRCPEPWRKLLSRSQGPREVGPGPSSCRDLF